MASILTWRKFVSIRSWTKEKNKICLEYLCKLPGISKESNQTICPMNESCRRKTRKVYQNPVWLMLLQKNSSLCVFCSLCKKKLFNIADHLKENFIQQIYWIFSFLTSIFNFSYRHIFETIKKTSIFLQIFIVLTRNFPNRF